MLRGPRQQSELTLFSGLLNLPLSLPLHVVPVLAAYCPYFPFWTLLAIGLPPVSQSLAPYCQGVQLDMAYQQYRQKPFLREMIWKKLHTLQMRVSHCLARTPRRQQRDPQDWRRLWWEPGREDHLFHSGKPPHQDYDTPWDVLAFQDWEHSEITNDNIRH